VKLYENLSPASRRELEDYFGGALIADMGLRSSAGPMLEAAMAASHSESAPRAPAQQDRGDAGGYLPMQVLKARQSSSGAHPDSTELQEGALEAARRHRRVEETLARSEPSHRRVLAWHYTWRPSGFLEGLVPAGDLALVACVTAGDGRIREVCARAGRSMAKLPPAAKAAAKLARAEARVELKRLLGVAKAALRDAHAAYELAAVEARASERARRHRRFGRSIGSGNHA
jgi:hypothetical protein